MTGNALEQALTAAAMTPSARPAFLRLLLDSDLFIITAGRPIPAAHQETTLAAGTKVSAEGIDIDGVPHTAFFTSLDALRVFTKEERAYMSMQGRALLTMMRRAHLILNPGGDFGKQFVPAEIEDILSGAAMGGPSTRVVPQDTSVLLAQPAVPPVHLTDALARVFQGERRVRAAYLALCTWPNAAEPPHLMIGLDASGDWKDLMGTVGPAITAAARPGEIVDVMRLDDSPPARYLRGTKPFFGRRKFLGLF